MIKINSFSAPDYMTPACRVVEVKVRNRILDGSPISASASIYGADELEYGEY